MEYVKDSQFGFDWGGWKKGITIFLTVILGAFIINWLNSPLIVTVTGSSEVSVPATSATVSLTVSAGDSSPQGAIDQVKTKANNLRQALRSTWVNEKDIMESQVTVVPAAAYIAGATGYQASLTIGAETLNLDGMDALISQLYSSGATVVAQPVLSADKQSELEAQAMDEAMNDAKQQANELAKKNFKLIKKIVLITQASSASTATATTKTEISGSEFKIAKAVQVSYKMW
ncbi:MAG: SIMPL domain-containing protein [Patescibacteria group bacterium]|nr:SIMPL domain-containing protein [Patescibacteria group bacterium]